MEHKYTETEWCQLLNEKSRVESEVQCLLDKSKLCFDLRDQLMSELELGKSRLFSFRYRKSCRFNAIGNRLLSRAESRLEIYNSKVPNELQIKSDESN